MSVASFRHGPKRVELRVGTKGDQFGCADLRERIAAFLFGGLVLTLSQSSFAALLVGLAVALLSSAIPYTLEMYALNHLPKNTFSVLLSLEPAVGALAGWVVLSERLSTSQWAAMAFIIGACMGSAGSAGRRSANSPSSP